MTLNSQSVNPANEEFKLVIHLEDNFGQIRWRKMRRPDEVLYECVKLRRDSEWKHIVQLQLELEERFTLKRPLGAKRACGLRVPAS